MQVNLYVGANNTTGVCEKEKAQKWIESVCDSAKVGYTCQDSIGYWQGKRENGAVFTIFTDNGIESAQSKFYWFEIAKGLATYLVQDCVCMQWVEDSEVHFCASYSPLDYVVEDYVDPQLGQ